MDSDKEKESTLTPTAQEAIGDAARANVNAAVEVGKSAVSSFVGALTGERKKSKTTRRGARRKKAASKGAASKRGKTKRSAGGRRSAAASTRRATRNLRPSVERRSELARGELGPPLRPVGPHGRLLLASVLEEAALK